MVRVLKKHAQRKMELVKAAWDLFASLGYEETTVQAIIDRLKISKGTFYHYFSSKEDLLDAVIQGLTDQGLARVRPVLEDPALPALDKLNLFLVQARAWRLENMDRLMPVLKAVFSQENLLLRHKMEARAMALAAPLLARIIVQGQEEGVFDTPSPAQAAETIIHLGHKFSEGNVKRLLRAEARPEALDDLRCRIDFLIDLLERILGAPGGSINRPGEELIRTLVRVLGGDES